MFIKFVGGTAQCEIRFIRHHVLRNTVWCGAFCRSGRITAHFLTPAFRVDAAYAHVALLSERTEHRSFTKIVAANGHPVPERLRESSLRNRKYTSPETNILKMSVELIERIAAQ